MSPIVTRPDPAASPAYASSSPGLAFARWHRYDGQTLETKETRLPFLREIAGRIDAVAASDEYGRWHQRHLQALRDLGADADLTAPTLWRLVAGSATNPALETGLHLHPLWGVPYLPGSSIKGLLHHYAEAQAVERAEEAAGRELTATVAPPDGAIESLLRFGNEVRQVFGGLVVDRGAWKPAEGPEERVGPETPRSLLGGWVQRKAIPEEHLPAVLCHLGGFTSGRLAVYDALPEPGQALAEPDVLNPHYPEYYGSSGDKPPSDDQNPRPVFFLAVRSGVRFRFPWRLCQRTDSEDPALSDDEIRAKVKLWLREALGTWGAGGKTAAGYGYFQLGESGESSRNRAGSEAGGAAAGERPEGEPVTEIWHGALLTWQPNDGRLVARWQQREAKGRREHLAMLPQELQDRLTGGPKREDGKRAKRKDARANVEVRVLGERYFEIVHVAPPGEATE